MFIVIYILFIFNVVAAKPRTNVPGGGPSQAEYQQPLPPQEAQNRKDHIPSHAAPEYKQPSHMSGKTLNTLSKQASHGNQPAGSVPSNAYQAVAGMLRNNHHLARQLFMLTLEYCNKTSLHSQLACLNISKTLKVRLQVLLLLQLRMHSNHMGTEK